MTSVRYDLPDAQLAMPLVVLGKLPNLARVHVIGDKLRPPALRGGTYECFGSITSLRLDHIFIDRRDTVREWAGALEHLAIISCRQEERIHKSDAAEDEYRSLPPALRSFTYRPRTSALAHVVITALRAVLVNQSIEQADTLLTKLSTMDHRDLMLTTQTVSVAFV